MGLNLLLAFCYSAMLFGVAMSLRNSWVYKTRSLWLSYIRPTDPDAGEKLKVFSEISYEKMLWQWWNWSRYVDDWRKK